MKTAVFCSFVIFNVWTKSVNKYDAILVDVIGLGEGILHGYGIRMQWSFPTLS